MDVLAAALRVMSCPSSSIFLLTALQERLNLKTRAELAQSFFIRLGFPLIFSASALSQSNQISSS
jgi:hypothetical protein